GVGLVALLAGWGVMRLRRRGQDGTGETSFIESKLQPDSFFGASGGQRVDTRDGASSAAASSSLSYSLSQLDAIGDVDPVAEADVYLAYGRDLQAEEILKEALRTDPSRAAIRTKLLEVYAKRADAEAFMQQARQLHEMTGGQGEDWARAAELGRQLDPAEPLFAATEDLLPATASLVDDAAPAATVEPDPLPEPDPVPAAAAAPAGPSSTYDIDIDLDSPSQLSGLENTRPMTASEPTMDLGESSVHGMLDDDPVTTRRGRLDELDLGEQTTPSAFDALAPELPPLSPPAPAPRDAQPSAPVDFDFGDLSLDLPGEPAAPPPPATGDDLDAGVGDPLQRKIELADEFRRIGDVEGARDLLQEVIEKSDGALKARAQSLLDEL
ncbi:MAG: hypothetical protein J0M20_09190, partial [Burkholderiales bacterium]|nr:hypothetical protein [Burkholderiales bacterium]